MRGQWIGEAGGETNQGFIVLNFFSGYRKDAQIMFCDFYDTKPCLWADVEWDVNRSQLTGKLKRFSGWKLKEGRRLKQEEIGENLPHSGVVNAVLTNDRISGTWETDIGTRGNFNLINRFYIEDDIAFIKANEDIEEVTWEDFKQKIDETYGDSESYIIYRGQKSAWPLRSSFCRAGGTCLQPYLKDCLTELARNVNSQSIYKYSLQKDDDIGALMSLAQHHGYPTPLLDWTESPYVAAFFAFEDNKKESRRQEKVCIFEMNFMNNRISDDFKKTMLEAPWPIIKVSRYPAFDNYRTLPQQSVGLFSNIDDIEEMIRIRGIPGKVSMKRFLLSGKERGKVMSDLRRMGITAASLFPGMDGICQSLKEKHFPSV